MEAIIDKVCNSLMDEVHIIGIILHCEDKAYTNQEGIRMCVISKEATTQRALFSENGVHVQLNWKSEEDFIKQMHTNTQMTGEVLYDKLGLIEKYMQ